MTSVKYICVSSKWDVHKLRLDIFDILHSLYPQAINLKSALMCTQVTPFPLFVSVIYEQSHTWKP